MKKFLLIISLFTLTCSAFADFNFLNKEGFNLLLRNAPNLNFKMAYDESDDRYNIADLLSEWMITSDSKTATIYNECNFLNPTVEEELACNLTIETVEQLGENEPMQGFLSISYNVNTKSKAVTESRHSIYMVLPDEPEQTDEVIIE